MMSLRRCVAGFILCAASSSTLAVSAYDTLGPSNLFDPNNSWAVGTCCSSGYVGDFVTSDQFVAVATGQLNSISMAFVSFVDHSFSIQAELRDGSFGLLPGPVLASISITIPAGPVLTSAIYTGSFSGPLTISANSTYWLTVGTNDVTALGGVDFNVLGAKGAHDYSLTNPPVTWFRAGQSVTQGAFRLDVSPVPEPTSSGLYLVGLDSLTDLSSV